MNKVFFSFLGTNDYEIITYYYKENKVSNVKYIQEAIIKIFCNDFTEEDKVVIFLTDAAKEANWVYKNVEKPGLKYILEKIKEEIGSKFNVIPISIPEGKTEQEIWDIFNIFFENINEKDKVILDITHGFRSLPMLGIVLLNYARFLKDISINGIYYGAYEARDKVKAEAPIFDITSFNQLLQWSSAADVFLNYGITGPIEKLIRDRARFILRKDSENVKARELDKFQKNLHKITEDFFTVRGKSILNGDKFEFVRNYMNNIGEEFVEAPFQIIKSKIQEKLSPFKSRNSIKNCIAAVEWYNKHGLIQQGITLMQELIVTFILKYLNYPWDDLNYRELTSYSIKIYTSKIPQSKWFSKVLEEKDKVKNLVDCEPLQKLAPVFDRLREIRNDINHGGFLKDARKSHVFINRLSDIYSDSKEIILSYEI